MIDSMIFFALGYFFAKMLQPKLRADILLYWNSDCMGWRPLACKSEMKPDMRYLAAVEVNPDQISGEEPAS